MPGVKRNREGEETENEEVEQDSETEHSSDEESSSSDASDSEESSELDEEECERRRSEFLSDLNDLERQFSLLKEQLYHERVTQVELKLEEVKLETAAEYIGPLRELTEALKVRLEVIEILRELKIKNSQITQEAGLIGSRETLRNDIMYSFDHFRGELWEKIRRLEEDRKVVEFSTQVWTEQNFIRKSKKVKQEPSTRNRKPTSVSGPYVVYMLRDSDIMDDWATIKKAISICDVSFQEEKSKSNNAAELLHIRSNGRREEVNIDRHSAVLQTPLPPLIAI